MQAQRDVFSLSFESLNNIVWCPTDIVLKSHGDHSEDVRKKCSRLFHFFERERIGYVASRDRARTLGPFVSMWYND